MTYKNLEQDGSTSDMENQIENELTVLKAKDAAMKRLSALLDTESLLQNLTPLITEWIVCERCIVLILDEEQVALEHSATYPKMTDIERQTMLEMIYINTFNIGDDPLLASLLGGQPVATNQETLKESRLNELSNVLAQTQLHLFPLMMDDAFSGLVVLTGKEPDLTASEHQIMQGIVESASIALKNAQVHSRIVKQLADNVHEMNILQQIDAELNDTIELNYVFQMIMDWALRFSNAHAAALALYDEDTDTMRVMSDYGYQRDSDVVQQLHKTHTGGITHRVARYGESEIVPDVMMDKDYISVVHNIRSQMSVPIIREDKVIAVLSLESKKLNGFTEGHLSFVNKLTQRAGVAIDNARLFTETRQERQKLSYILSNIADIVIVVGFDNRIVLINNAAISGFRLTLKRDYTGMKFNDVLEPQNMRNFLRRATEMEQGLIEEMTLPNSKVYHAQIAKHERIGWIIVMQDITFFKETDKLKSELIATVSHDLKQPLSVMRGYLDLLQMRNIFDEKSQHFVDNLNRAIGNMRELIDGLLDLARIESGLDLNIVEIDLAELLKECVDTIKPGADEKKQTLLLELPESIPALRGDFFRLSQIFNNLVGNAVKYTQESGEIKVMVEVRGMVVRVNIQDNGMGISPEDQAHIFDRFYRVRRPETENIDGTGLGLAIVKSLVEAHKGKIALTSELGVGSTFHVTLPVD